MDRTVAKYYAFEVARSAHLSTPIWVLFLLSRGVTYSGIGLLDAAFSLTVILSEVPTGYVGDRLGRRWALVFGTAGTAVASAAFAFGNSLPTFLVAYVALAVSQTFASGSDSAWLYDTLAARTDEGSFTRIRGRGKALGLASSGVAAVAGGLLGSVDLAWPWLASAAVTALAVPIALSFPVPDGQSTRTTPTPRPDGGDSSPDDADPEPETDGTDAAADAGAERDGDDDTGVGRVDASDEWAALVVARDLLTGPLRPFVLYTALFVGAMGVVDFFVQPVTRDAIVDASAVLGVQPDPVVVVGLVYAAFTVVSATVTANADRVRSVVGLGRWFRYAPAGLGALFAGLAVLPVAAVPLFFVLRAVRNLTEPLLDQYLNDRTPSVGRATTLSAVAMAHAVVEIPLWVGGGRLADALDPIATMAILGAGLVVTGVVLSRVALGDTGTGRRRPRD